MKDTPERPFTRRETLRLLALGVTGSAILPRLAAACDTGISGALNGAARDSHVPAFGYGKTAVAPRIERIGLQLYTVRRSLSAGIEPVFEALERAGIAELEFAGYYDKPSSYWLELMKKHGMTSPATHVGMPATDAEWAPHFARAVEMGQKWVVVPSVPSGYRGADGWKRLAARLNESGELAKRSGLRIGYHNHDGEFARPDGAEAGLDVLLRETDPSLVDFELDIYWAVKGGRDPMSLLTEHPSRFACCHVKDAGPAPERTMLDVGAGTIDFQSLLNRGRQGSLRHWFIEHDNPGDPIASVTASAAALKKLT